MSFRSFRVALIVGGVAVALLASPPESQAIWHWFCRDKCGDTCNPCGEASARTTYAPPYSPPYASMFVGRRMGLFAANAPAACCPTPTVACAPACPTPCATTCSYVPQTCYRAVYENVPVTTCNRVTMCDPCSGCPVTTFRPTTSFVRQVRMVPYTTYRMVYSNACSPCGAAPAMVGATSAVGGCSSCAAAPMPSLAPALSAAPAASVAPTLVPGTPTMPGQLMAQPTPMPQQMPAGVQPSTSGAPATFAPGNPVYTPATPPGAAPAGTTPPAGGPTTAVPAPTPTPMTSYGGQMPIADPRLRPIPDVQSPAVPPAAPANPRLVDPDNRTTARPVIHASYIALATHEKIAAPAPTPAADDEGWRPAKRP